MDIKYDVPFEVSEAQYNALMRLSMVVAGRKDSETSKFYIKVWMMKHIDTIQSILSNIK